MRLQFQSMRFRYFEFAFALAALLLALLCAFALVPGQAHAAAAFKSPSSALGKNYLMLYPKFSSTITLKAYTPMVFSTSEGGTAAAEEGEEGEEGASEEAEEEVSDGIVWSSDDKKIATVKSTDAGKAAVTGVAPGHCTVTAKYNGKKYKCSIEVTSKKGYLAVQNGLEDMNTKLYYSLGNRMKKKYRDCSSFVSRCYWDASLGRKLYAIGGKSAKTWALPAYDQAAWLKKKGKTIAYSASVDLYDLLPGDTIYYGDSFGGIDHASMYAGNGKILDGSGHGGKGTVGFRYQDYSKGLGGIVYIGRPVNKFILNKTLVSLKAATGTNHTFKLVARFAPSKVTWKSSDKSVVKVSKKGKLTAVKKGKATITCTSGTKKLTCTVKVK